VSGSRGRTVGPVIEIGPAQLRILALTIVSVLRYSDGSWVLNDVRDKTLRHDLDALATLHGQPLMGQRRPFHTRVRVYSGGQGPLHVDPAAVKADLAARQSPQTSTPDICNDANRHKARAEPSRHVRSEGLVWRVTAHDELGCCRGAAGAPKAGPPDQWLEPTVAAVAISQRPELIACTTAKGWPGSRVRPEQAAHA